jgi:hypothetical protein
MGKRYKANERERLIETVQASGESVKAVAKRLGVKEATAYYWMKRGREREPVQFARVIRAPLMPKVSMSIDVGGVVIRLDSGFDAELLREVVAALKGVLT